MFAVSEVITSSQQPSATQLHILYAASAPTTQRIAAMAHGDASPDAGMQTAGKNSDAARMVRDSIAKRNSDGLSFAAAQSGGADDSAMRSIVEAQEASETKTVITAAFHARHALTDLLSVIRDPEDRMLPVAPSDRDHT